jgi:hypothetical protein
MTTGALSEFLRTAVRSRGDSAARMWFDDALMQLAGGTGELLASYTKARRLGRAPLSLSAAEKTDAAHLQPDVQFDHWTLEDAGRAVLLLSAATASPDSFVRDATDCYDHGDSAEQQSWLKSTALLPEPEQLLPIVIDACRTNILPLFEAVACENPFPGRYFPERNFNQMVLKALFNKVALSRIAGLAGRRNADLTRMAADYASERRAAGRTVPSDIGLAMTETP